MKYPLVAIGAGGFGHETLDVVDALSHDDSGPELLGVVDDSPTEASLRRLHERGVEYLGSLETWLLPEHDSEHFVVSIGHPKTRSIIAEQIEAYGRTAATLVHPTATIGTMHTIGHGTIVCAGALISTNVRFGKHVHINPGAIIGHDANLADYVSINPGAIISGAVSIETGSLVGAGATVLQNLTLGANSLVGAGACVVREVPRNTLVRGVPAK